MTEFYFWGMTEFYFWGELLL